MTAQDCLTIQGELQPDHTVTGEVCDPTTERHKLAKRLHYVSREVNELVDALETPGVPLGNSFSVLLSALSDRLEEAAKKAAALEREEWAGGRDE